MLNPQLAWYVAGPLLGLCVIACRLLFNARLGVTGGYSAIVDRVRHGHALVGPVLLGAGVLIGYGAKVAGGCTSGNGLTGTSMLSPASLAATATFFATAIAVSFLTEALF